MNDSMERLLECRAFTAALRDSDVEYWPAVRGYLRHRGIDPTRAVVGGVWPDQTPVVLIVTPDADAFALDIEEPQRDQLHIGRVQDLASDPEGRFIWSPEIHSGLTLIAEESPGSVDPVGALVDAIGFMTTKMRTDPASEGLRRLLLEEGIDPSGAIEVESWAVLAGGREGERHVVIMSGGRWMELQVGEDVLTKDFVGVPAWRILDEAEVRRAHGEYLDAALRFAAAESAGAAG